MKGFNFYFVGILSIVLLGLSPLVFGQKPLNPPKQTEGQSLVEVLNADIHEGVNIPGQEGTFFTGNVIFRHKGVLMGCDRAIRHSNTNVVEAFGNIKINQGDTLTIVGDTLYYDGNTRIATIWGRTVILRDKKVTLRTTKVIYDMATGMAHYPVPGNIRQDSSILSSRTGYYNTRTKYFNYIGDVQIDHPDFLLCTDSLDYDTHTKNAIFKTFTTVKSKNGDLAGEKGFYNIETRASKFYGRSMVSNEKYILAGDTLDFDNQNDYGWARGNVVFHSKADSITTVGNEGIRDGKRGITKINGETVTRMESARDSALLAADSLVIIERVDSLVVSGADTVQVHTQAQEPSRESVEKVIAIGNVKVYRKDLQSISDSLVYNMVDSVIGFYKKPYIWHKKEQLKADTIRSYLVGNKLQRVEMIRNCFMIELDTHNNFNQMKGRNITAFFSDSSTVEEIRIFGNCQAKYYILDDDMRVIGLDVVESSSMNFIFGKDGLEQLKCYTDYEAQLIPPHELTLAASRFEDFDWKISEKPSKESIMGLRLAPLLNSLQDILNPVTSVSESGPTELPKL